MNLRAVDVSTGQGVLSAIESAVGHLLAQGIERRLWQVAGDAAAGQAAVDKYLSQNRQQ